MPSDVFTFYSDFLRSLCLTIYDNVCTKSYWVRKFELVGVGGGYPGLCRRLIFP
jgi:hypothetical protein